VGNFQREPVMPQEAHVGYVEGYLDALAACRRERRRNRTNSWVCGRLVGSMDKSSRTER